MAIVTIRYWAAAKEAAGVAEHELTAETLAGALSAASGDRVNFTGAGDSFTGTLAGAGSPTA